MKSIILLGATLATIAAQTATAGNILINGSFEANAIHNPTPFYGAGLSGWTITGGGSGFNTVFLTGDTGFISSMYIDKVKDDLTLGIGQAAAFNNATANVSDQISLSQTFATSIGGAYSVSFYLADTLAQGSGPNCVVGINPNCDVANSAAIKATVAGVTNTYSRTSDIGWVLKTFSFVATSATSTLTFTDVTPSTNFLPAIDAVSVVSTATPEPGTYLLMAGALIGIGTVRKRYSSR